MLQWFYYKDGFEHCFKIENFKLETLKKSEICGTRGSFSLYMRLKRAIIKNDKIKQDRNFLRKSPLMIILFHRLH